mmetsp:Transcript_32232/g.47404  ORF Transcript_32232/g.47404 Transcript_32232/m.47404 type:complete len:109 (+) Transcript_32232:25-351(+)
MTAFERWIAQKDKYERGRNLLRTLDVGRLDDYDDKALTMAAVAIDCALGCLDCQGGGSKKGKEKTMKAEFFSWLKNNYAFCDVDVPATAVKKFSDGAKSMLREEVRMM